MKLDDMHSQIQQHFPCTLPCELGFGVVGLGIEKQS